MSMLHVLNGDAPRPEFERAGLPGELAVWAEALHDGPIPSEVEGAAWRQVRAHFYAEQGWGSLGENLRRLEGWDTPLERFADHEEIIFWFESDLFDQLLLIRHLDWFSRRDLRATRLSLVQVDRDEATGRFLGVGHLGPEDVAARFPTREPIGPDLLGEARRAWAAFTSPDPTAIEGYLARGRAVPALWAEAFTRHLQEFPSVANGLGRTEGRALEMLAEGPKTPGQLFVAGPQREDRPYLGDDSFFAILNRLAQGPRPLIEPVGPTAPADFASTPLRLTELGGAILAGRVDRVLEAGIDRWLGGAHLRGHEVAWRWDDRGGRLVGGPTAA